MDAVVSARGSDSDLADAFAVIARSVADFGATLSPRDALLVKIGLRAAHAEEALALEEPDRARSHFDRMLELVRELGRAPS